MACYHEKVVFTDPAFGVLHGNEARNMWRMLVERGGEQLKVSHSQVQVSGAKGSAQWRAEYPYGPKKRLVVNHIQAQFVFQDGKIIEHTDHFDLWKWTRQALGISGYLLGWSGFMQSKIQQRTRGLLKRYSEKQG